MSASRVANRCRYPTSVMISLAVHGAVALALSLVIVAGREAVPTGFSAEFVLAPTPDAREKPLRHRRVPPTIRLSDTLQKEFAPTPSRSTATPAQGAPVTTAIGAWSDGSALVRTWQELPAARMTVPRRQESPPGFAPEPAAALDAGRTLGPKPITPDEPLPGLSSLLIASPAPTTSSDPRPEYLALLQKTIARSQRYPRFAREGGIEGTTVLVFTVERTGRLAELRVAESSGHKVLDDAARAAIRDAAPFPPFPPEQTGPMVHCRIPIVFTLDQTR